MQAEYKSLDRWLARIVREICMEQGIEFRSLSHDWLWELKKDGKISRVLGYVFDLNSAAASSVGRDKVAAYELLKAYDIPAVRHILSRGHRGSEMEERIAWHQGVVAKPLRGKGGHNVRLFFDAGEGYDYMQKQKVEAWALSPLQDITQEIRVILLDGRVVLAFAKQPVTLHGLKVFNLNKGATPVGHALTLEQETMAKKAQETLGLRLAAVDLAELASGELKILEMNSAITLEEYAGYSAKNEQEARNVYEEIIKAIFSSGQ